MSTLQEGCFSVRELNAAAELLNQLFEEVKERIMLRAK